MAATLLSLLFHTLFFFLSFLPAPIRRLLAPSDAAEQEVEERLEPEPQSVLAVGTSDGHVLLLDAATGKIRLNVQSHDVHTNAAQRAGPRAAQRAGAACVALSPDGHLIATASWDGAWKLLDAGSGVERVRGQRHDGEGGCVCEMQGGGGEHGWGWAVDPACTVIGHSGIVRGIAFAPCGRLLATGGTDKSVILWGVETGRAQRRMLGHTQGVNAVAFTPDGQRLASCSDDGSVRVWECRTGALVHALVEASENRRTRVNCVAFSHDGARLAAGGHDRLAKVWDAETWEILHIFGGHRGAVTSVALGLDGALASGGRDNAVLVHQAASMTPRFCSSGHDGWDGCLCISDEDGLGLYAEPECTVVGHRGWVRGVAFSMDGRTLASCGDDGTCKLWDAADGALLRTIELGAVTVCSVAFGVDWMQGRDRWVAFAMGQADRLGDASRVKGLDAGVVRMVLEATDPLGPVGSSSSQHRRTPELVL